MLFEGEGLCLELEETLFGCFCCGFVRVVGEAGRWVFRVVCVLGVGEGRFG